MSTETNSKSCETSEMELFPRSSSSLQRQTKNIAKHLRRSFCKNCQKLNAVHYLRKNLYLGCLKRFWISFEVGFQSWRCFIFKSIWISKVTDKLLLGKKKKTKRKTKQTSKYWSRHQSLTRVFSCDFCEIFRNNFFTEHLVNTSSGNSWTKMFVIRTNS